MCFYQLFDYYVLFFIEEKSEGKRCERLCEKYVRRCREVGYRV